ncbi:unnamed protein product [Blepharisma stoltei]|uniref:Uncharacterized protein n=1 Tax=Blepharisma stoltei TaxID=1481888 RepID=A0AAU9K1X2_9CILI|nr:unnamed protein product [Blepharisma stoltei]
MEMYKNTMIFISHFVESINILIMECWKQDAKIKSKFSADVWNLPASLAKSISISILKLLLLKNTSLNTLN